MVGKENTEKPNFDEAYRMLQFYQDQFRFYIEFTVKMRFRYLCCVLIVSSLPFLSEFMGVKIDGIFPSIPTILKYCFPGCGIILAFYFCRQMKIEMNRQDQTNVSRLRQLELLGRVRPEYDFKEYREEKEDKKEGIVKSGGHLLNIFYLIVEVLWCVFCIIVLKNSASLPIAETSSIFIG